MTRRWIAGTRPRIRPELKTVEYTGGRLQARQVGGDYFDFLALGSEQLGLIFGDDMASHLYLAYTIYRRPSNVFVHI